MRPGPVAGRRHVDPARIGLGVGYYLGNRFGLKRWVHQHDEGLSDDGRDRRDVAAEIEIELVVERRVDHAIRTNHEQRIAVRGRLDDSLGADIAAGAWPVVDDEGLAEPVRQPLTHQAREDVVWSAGWIRDDYSHQSRRMGLRLRDARHGSERGSNRRQMQKSTT